MELPAELQDALRKQLSAQTHLLRLIHVVNILMAVALGIIAEPFFKADAPWDQPGPLIKGAICLFICIICTLLLFAAERPLPHFLVEFDNISKKIKEQAITLETRDLNCLRTSDALYALAFSIASYNELNDSNMVSLQDDLEKVMAPWVENRHTIFDFKYSDELWNFAIYGLSEVDGQEKLSKVWRKTHEKLKQTNRSWRPGEGNIGKCYQEQEVILFPETQDPDTALKVLDEIHSANTLPEDSHNYKSFVATPIMAHNLPVGVLIVTSSKLCHFSRDDHLTIVDSLGIVVGMVWELYVPQEEAQ